MSDNFEWAKPSAPKRSAVAARVSAIDAGVAASGLDEATVALIVDAVSPILLLDARVNLDTLQKDLDRVRKK